VQVLKGGWAMSPAGRQNFENGASILNQIVFCLGKFGGWGWEEFSMRGLGFWLKISADMTANRGLSRRGCGLKCQESQRVDFAKLRFV